jgi:hypothetical protein
MHIAREKLREAGFFLAKVRAHAMIDLHSIRSLEAPPELRYYLSAFVSAARSVTWVMGSEYRSRPGWSKWFKQWPLEQPLKILLRQTNEARIGALKRGDLVPVASMVLVAEDLLDSLCSQEEAAVLRAQRAMITIRPIADTGREGDAVVVRLRSWEWRVDHFNDRNLVEVCEEYYTFLESLLRACEMRWPASAPVADFRRGSGAR